MPRTKHIKITIRADGTCTVDAINFTGPACQVATTEITQSLGGRIEHSHAKPEMRLRETPGQAEPEPSR